MNNYLETPDLSKSWNPVPKPLAKVKIPKAMKAEGKKTISWTEKRNELKIKHPTVKFRITKFTPKHQKASEA